MCIVSLLALLFPSIVCPSLVFKRFVGLFNKNGSSGRLAVVLSLIRRRDERKEVESLSETIYYIQTGMSLPNRHGVLLQYCFKDVAERE